jgi:RNA polymerase sigma-70 factor (ECF subfamily)
MSGDASQSDELLRRAAAGDRAALGKLLSHHRDRLRRMVALRLDGRLHGRLDPSDVVQDVFLEATAHLAEYAREPRMTFFLWLRGITGNKLLELHRRHLGTRMRDASQEVALYRGRLPATSSAALAAQLLGRETQPSEAAARAERKFLLQEALNGMDPIDREVLALRHFEQLSTAEAAAELGITEAAAAKRYVRALKRLKQILQSRPGGLEGVRP